MLFLYCVARRHAEVCSSCKVRVLGLGLPDVEFGISHGPWRTGMRRLSVAQRNSARGRVRKAIANTPLQLGFTGINDQGLSEMGKRVSYWIQSPLGGGSENELTNALAARKWAFLRQSRLSLTRKDLLDSGVIKDSDTTIDGPYREI